MTATGGGYGNPLKRLTLQVAKDVKNEYITIAQAKEVFGVVINSESFEVDGASREREISMDILNIRELSQEGTKSYSMHIIFKEQYQESELKVGYVTIYPGETVPLTGVSKHEENEYSVIVKGSLVTEIDGKKYRVSAGQATFIPKGEEHIAVNDGEEDCELVFVMVG